MIVQTSEKVDKILPALVGVKKSMSRLSKSWSASVLIKDKSTGTDRFSFDHTTLPVLNSIIEPFLRFNDLLCINPILVFLIINQNILEKFFLFLFFHSPL